MTERRKGHAWQPIEDVAAPLQSLRFPELDALLEVFERRRAEIEGIGALRAFQARTVREWSIETGILENLYTLSPSATLTLLQQGFDAALLSHGDTDLPAESLVEILRDHQDAAEGLFQFVRGGRVLSTSYVKELHQVLTRHQDTCDAIDPSGQRVKLPLQRGDWKTRPNNPGDSKTGAVWHHYCPPEQVASEMDRLLSMHAQHTDVHYVVTAAWLHHRFTQIHPFQDGNGRVARALASLVSIRAHGFPVVVSRTQKADYIRALEMADQGDLRPLVDMFERQQRTAFTRALSLSYAAVEDTQSIEAILADAKRRLAAAAAPAPDDLPRRVEILSNDVLIAFGKQAAAIDAALAPHVHTVVTSSTEGKTDHFQAEIFETAKWHDYEPNMSGPKRWLELRLEHRGSSSIVVSFHHVGPVEYGVMAAAAFLLLGRGVRDVAAQRTTLFPIEFLGRPLTFTTGRDEGELRVALADWVERSLQNGLGLWRRGL